MNIYVHKDGTNYGPYTLDQLKEYLQQGSFSLQDQACHDGQNWIPVAQLPGMTPAQSSPQNQNPAPTKSKTVQTNPSTAQSSQQTASSGKKTSGRKRLYLYGAIGVNLIIVIIGLCWWIFSGDDETKEPETQLADANKEVEPDTSEEISSDDSESASNTPSIPDTPLIERIPSDAGAVLLIRINDLLEKGRKDITSLLPPELPPMAGKAIDDPTSLGLDLSEPLQIHVVAIEEKDVSPFFGMAGKLSDREKFINTVELLAGLDKAIEKDGYHLFPKIDKEGAFGMGIGPDFFILIGSDPNKSEEIEPLIETFIQADGSDSLLTSESSFAKISKDQNDFSLWFGGDEIYGAIDANLGRTDFEIYQGGHGNLTLNFDKGEMVMAMEFEAPNEEMVYGNGKFSDKILSLTPSDAVFTMGFAVNMMKMIDFTQREILPEFSKELNMDVDLDETIPELGGLTINDAISAFTGELMISLTDVKMPDPKAGIGGFPGAPMDAAGDSNPFGEGDLPPPGGSDPFGDPEMEENEIPFPEPGAVGGFPGAGPASGVNPGAMMMAAMPKPEFIVAASIEPEKWLKLKAAPPLAMGLGFAMMQGISITEKDNFLIIASKEHLAATQSGSVENPVNGVGREIFQTNDFVLRINVAPILDMDLPIPPDGPVELIRGISHLEIFSNSSTPSGSGAMKLVFSDKNENSLSQILKLVKAVLTILPASIEKKDLDDMEEDFEFE